ncbi:PepSY-associated TM helix domain-containing protein [Methylobacterium fujisawaense]|uniref:PepSY-associated TM helix domain-containing protein n=1 Tax=Methylobacterium fujisawaense TaxID=107400 RepID=UPI0031F57600
MGKTFRQSMAWLHTWSGLVVGWILFAVFVTGTASYYRTEISQWMRPELRYGRTFGPAELAAAADRGVAYLQAHARGARTWFITLPRPEMPVLELFWRTGPGRPPGHILLDPDTGALAAVRETRGGDFLYRFHFELSLPPLWGRWIVGICAMIMLVALISGVITHRRIFVDFFTFRRRADQRGWLDAHNVTGVLALPFHLMITYTGLITLSVMYMPWGLNAAYRGDTQRYYVESGQITAPRPPTGSAGELAPVGPMVVTAISKIAQPLERLTIVNPRDANSTVVAVFEEPYGLSHQNPQIAFNGPTGQIVEIRAGDLGPATATFTTMVGLHEAHFAGPALRALFFLSGLSGCAMVATGLVLWSVARLPKKAAASPIPLGHRLVHALNVGTVAGLPIAVACYFLANRLFPVAMPGRSEVEVRFFFAGWLSMALVGLLADARRAWIVGVAMAAAAFFAIPAVDCITIGYNLVARTYDSDAAFVAFDAAALFVGAGFSFATYVLVNRRAHPQNFRQSASRGGIIET